MSSGRGGRRLSAGIVGGGGIGQVHIDALLRLGIEVTAIAGSSPESARSVADRFTIPVAAESVEELVAHPQVDVVHVCTPNSLHAEHVELALRARKHVVCEKPLAVSSAEGARLLESAEQSGCSHAVVYNYRYNAVVRALRRKLAAGALGHVHLFYGTYLAEFVLLEEPGAWIFDPALAGPAFALADIGIHWWDLVEHVARSRVRSVLCSARTARPDADRGEDSIALQMRMEDGALASAVISSAAAGHSNSISLGAVGTEGSAMWEQETPDLLTLRSLDGPTAIWRRPLGDLDEERALGIVAAPKGHPQGYLDSFRGLFARVYGGIEGRIPADYPTFADGVRGLGILEAMIASSSSGSWADVAE